MTGLERRRLKRARLVNKSTGKAGEFPINHTPTFNILVYAGFETVADLVRVQPKEFTHLTGFGPKARKVLQECRNRLRDMGLDVDTMTGYYMIGVKTPEPEYAVYSAYLERLRALERQIERLREEYYASIGGNPEDWNGRRVLLRYNPWWVLTTYYHNSRRS